MREHTKTVQHIFHASIPYILLGVIVLILAWTNRTPGTYLIGWDNLMTEFNPLLNLKRALFAVWQEYQGLGLFTGNAHAADLPRQLILILLSLMLPQNLVRYVWTFFMLFLGAAGVYTLLNHFVLRTLFPTLSSLYRKTGALLGALYYLTNLGTTQMFSVPYESFTTHFGFLPWLLYGFIMLLEHWSKRTIILFCILLFFAAPQAHIPTIFLVSLIPLFIIACAIMIQKPTKQLFTRILVSFGIVFCINAFWLLPFITFSITRASVVTNAKINQMATEEVYLRNKAFGTLLDTMQLKGFWLDTFDLNPEKQTTVAVLNQWRQYADTPLVEASLLFLFGVMLLGVWVLVRYRRRSLWWIIALFLISMTLLTTNTPPFSWIQEFLRMHVPLFAQIFRFPFTKFSTMASLAYALLFAIGTTYFLLERKKIKQSIAIVLLSFSIIAATLQAAPLFEGNLFYPVLRQELPDDYQQLFSYMKTQPAGRIANLPQYTYWGWTYESWGYSGSGFLWYGIEQPILDRAFDVWGGYNENYYWELSYALYSKNPKMLEAVLNKYAIQYILLDEYIESAGHSRMIFTDETKQLLAQIPSLSPSAQFGKLIVYTHTLPNVQSFVSIKKTLPTVAISSFWTDNDIAYQELGDYYADSPAAPTYPFRSLFTKRSIQEHTFTVSEDSQTLRILSSTTPQTITSINRLTAQVFDASPSSILTESNTKACLSGKTGPTSVTTQTENALTYLRLTSTDNRVCLTFPMSDLWHRDGYLVKVISRHGEGRPLTLALINKTVKHTEIETQLSDDSDWQTDYFILPPLAPDGKGYDVYIANDAIGQQTSSNDIANISVYTIPYEDMVTSKITNSELQITHEQNTNEQITSVEHPNPAYYKISYQQSAISNQTNQTLILFQSFDPGWKAYVVESCQSSAMSCQIKNKIQELFPFFFGKELDTHMLVNNWANGWVIEPSTISYQTSDKNTQPSDCLKTNGCELKAEIILFFLPQLLEWMGFLLLPIPFLLLLKKNRLHS